MTIVIHKNDEERESGDRENCLENYSHCKKSEGHKEFTMVKDLTLADLPDEMKHPDWLELIHFEARKTVKLTVSCTSPNRVMSEKCSKSSGAKGFRRGTGSVECLEAKDIQSNEFTDIFGKINVEEAESCFIVITAKHVAYDQAEVQNTIVTFFFKELILK